MSADASAPPPSPSAASRWTTRLALISTGYCWLVTTALTVHGFFVNVDPYCHPTLTSVVRAVALPLQVLIPLAVVLSVAALALRPGDLDARLRSPAGVAFGLALGFLALFAVWPAPQNAVRNWFGMQTDFSECAPPSAPQPIRFQF